MRCVHMECLQRWFTSPYASRQRCEVCHSSYQLRWKQKAVFRWQWPHFTREERIRMHMLAVSYLLAGVDIGFSVRWFLLPLMSSALGPLPVFGLKLFILCMTWGSWVYIFYLHTR